MQAVSIKQQQILIIQLCGPQVIQTMIKIPDYLFLNKYYYSYLYIKQQQLFCAGLVYRLAMPLPVSYSLIIIIANYNHIVDNKEGILLRLINCSRVSYYDLDWTRFFTLSPVKNTRGHHMKLYKKHSRLQLRENFFTQRVINMGNSLPETVVSASTVSVFKQNLMSFGIAQDMIDIYKGLVPKLYL